MTTATTSKAPRMYLLAANQDSDGADELRNRAELSEAGTSAGISRVSEEEASDVWTAMTDNSIGTEVRGSGVAVTATAGAGLATLGAGSLPLAGSRWPRHCFSSHSTQKVRPCDTGKPQAWHFCRFLNTGGTAIVAASSLDCPLAWHFCRFLNTGGTAIVAAS